MPFQRPTLSELVVRIKQDFVSRFGVVGAVLRRSVIDVLAKVLAGAAHYLHGHMEWISKQVLPDTADEDWLIRHAALYGLALEAATYAKASVTVTGTSGTIIPAGTVLLRSDAEEYLTDAEVTISGGTTTADVTAVVAGSGGTLEAAQELTFESPLAGVDSTVTVVASTLDGTDQESADALEARLLERLRNPPAGGAEADYVAWAKTVAGVTRVWVYPLELGAGTVTVRFVRDNDSGSIIPSAGEVTAVQDVIDALRPVTASVTVAAPIGMPLNFTIDLTSTGDTAAARAAIEAELEDMLLRDAEPGGTILLSHILTAIGVADGVADFTLSSPAADVTHTGGQLATMGTITWI